MSTKALLVAIVLAGAITACGSEEKQPSQGADLTAVKCPLEPTGKTVGGQPEYRPARNSFDTKQLIGLKLAAAQTKAAQKGCEVAVSLKDGAGQPVPIVLNPKLIYVYTEHDVVTQIEGVGGGI